MFSYGLLLKVMPLLIDQQEFTYISSMQILLGVMVDQDGWQERESKNTVQSAQIADDICQILNFSLDLLPNILLVSWFVFFILMVYQPLWVI